MCNFCEQLETDWSSHEQAHKLLALLDRMRRDDAERIRPQILSWIESQIAKPEAKRPKFVCEEVSLAVVSGTTLLGCLRRTNATLGLQRTRLDA
jgi:hypothetical protein